ncbi:winged helix-turn-helix domain-containing protein [Streptomyces sp. NPDC090045]|uniref:helix-turn-helix domain-containing protein n=1 Tax=Streptomyces sp. NPDC090045 TaxID=3365927 RepID=UPI00382CF908
MDSGAGADCDPSPVRAESVGGDGWRLLKRHGWSWQGPARRALECDERSVELWKREVWPRVKASRRPTGAGSSSRTKPDSP